MANQSNKNIITQSNTKQVEASSQGFWRSGLAVKFALFNTEMNKINRIAGIGVRS